MPEIKPAVLESLVGLTVHDLRNPAAAIGANLGFVREVLGDPSVEPAELEDALSDAQQALYDLMRGLDQLSFIGRWCNDKLAAATEAEPLGATFARVRARVKYGLLEVSDPPLTVHVRGGDALERLLDVLIANGHQHAPRSVVKLRALIGEAEVVVEVEDRGRPLASELQPLAFTLEGQAAVKGRSEGRYGRVVSLFSAAILAQALDARLDAVERAGSNVFRVTLKRL